MSTSTLLRFYKKYRSLVEWAVILSIFGIIYLGGWQTQVFGTLQGFMLKTGLFNPDLEQAESLGTTDLRMQLVNAQNEKVSLQDYQGKVVFINFWATWCPPCIAEMPDIDALYQRVQASQPDDVVFVMASVDAQADRVWQFADRKSFSFPIYQARSVPAEFSSQSIPTTYVIDKQGQIVLKQEGMAQYDTDEFVAFLLQLADA